MSRAGAVIRNPATGEVLGPLAVQPPEDLAAAVAAARRAQPAWAALPVRERAARIGRISGLIEERADTIAEVISRTTGKARVDAMRTEVLPGAMTASFYAWCAPRVERRHRLRGGSILLFFKRSYLTRVPFGVVGIISPWNYPFSIPLHEVLAGLVAGNGVVLKVATQTQAVGEVIASLVRDVGVPAELFHLVHLPGRTSGDAMLAAGVDKLFFTGSTAVGRELMEKAGRTLTPVALELGGNDAMIVLDDAHVERAAGGALWAGLSNAGQSCASVERLYVCRSVWPAFRDELLRQAGGLRVGPDTDFDVDVGSLTTTEQQTKVEELVADARSRGASVLWQSPEPPRAGIFHPLVILEGGDEQMRVLRDEIFGPVMVLRVVAHEEEAVRRANDSNYGLTASVWSGNRRRAWRVAARLHAGAVMINDHMMSHGMPETPWGGFRQSGIGRSHGEAGLLEMYQPRAVVDDLLHRANRQMWWYPYDARVYKGLRSTVTALYGRGPLQRLAALLRVAALFLRSFRSEG